MKVTAHFDKNDKSETILYEDIVEEGVYQSLHNETSLIVVFQCEYDPAACLFIDRSTGVVESANNESWVGEQMVKLTNFNFTLEVSS